MVSVVQLWIDHFVGGLITTAPSFFRLLGDCNSDRWSFVHESGECSSLTPTPLICAKLFFRYRAYPFSARCEMAKEGKSRNFVYQSGTTFTPNPSVIKLRRVRPRSVRPFASSPSHKSEPHVLLTSNSKRWSLDILKRIRCDSGSSCKRHSAYTCSQCCSSRNKSNWNLVILILGIGIIVRSHRITLKRTCELAISIPKQAARFSGCI